MQPLYGDVTSATAAGPVSGAASALRSVEVKPVDDRVGQEVRNHLIFLLNGGAGQPANPLYSLDIDVVARRSSAASAQSSAEDLEPTAAIVTLRGSYVLTEVATGKRISAGARRIQSPYDVPRQGFAAQRAQRDAQDRAARELAELLRLVIAQELHNATSTAVPAMVSAPQDLDGIADEESPGNLPTE